MNFCANCGVAIGVGRLCQMCAPIPPTPEPPPLAPLTRDDLLREISRSLRETHPENAEVMIRELERWMPPEGTVGALVAQPSDPPPRLRFW